VTSPPPGALPRGQTGKEPPLVLIVDDNQKNLKLARDVLRAAGLRTLEAESGADGMALAAEHLPDVILMDLRLPDMNGTDAVRTLGEGARTARIPVVALSALPFDGDGDWVLAAGFAGYLEKPINIGEFPDQVRGYCARTAGCPVPPRCPLPGVAVLGSGKLSVAWCASTPSKGKRAGLAHRPAPRTLAAWTLDPSEPSM
jgi:two-component system, cell cycle response regulator DivK